MWHEWNANDNDVMRMWFALHANLSDATSGMHDTSMYAQHMCSM